MSSFITRLQSTFLKDFNSALLVSLLLIPQSAAYALLAQVPISVGFASALAPLLAYALFGSSVALSVGPVAVIGLMSASASIPLVAQGFDPIVVAFHLAALVALFCFLMPLLHIDRLIGTLLTPSVIHGFMSAAALLIILSQLTVISELNHLKTQNVIALWNSYVPLEQAPFDLSFWNMTFGLSILFLLLLLKYALPALARRFALFKPLLRIAPLLPSLILISSILVTYAFFDIWQHDLNVVGVFSLLHHPWGDFHLLPIDAIVRLIPSAVAMTMVSFIESLAIARSIVPKEPHPHTPALSVRKESYALAAANAASALSSGMAVSASFSRSLVNQQSGVATHRSGIYAMLLVGAFAFLVPDSLHYLPVSALSALTISAIVGLIHLKPVHDPHYCCFWMGTLIHWGTFALGMFFSLTIALSFALVLSALFILYEHLRKRT